MSSYGGYVQCIPGILSFFLCSFTFCFSSLDESSASGRKIDTVVSEKIGLDVDSILNIGAKDIQAQGDRPLPLLASVDGDPHFIVQVNGLKDSLCFDVTGTHGDVINLVYDELSGITVNARVASERGFRKGKRVETYLGAVRIMRDKFAVHVTPKKIKLGSKSLNWNKDRTIVKRRAKIKISNKALAIAFDNGVLFAVFRHLRTKPWKRDYLGFYIANATGLSEETHGLLGQFMFKNFTLTKTFAREKRTEGRLKVASQRNPDGQYLMATVGHRSNLALGKTISCWIVRQVTKIIDGKYDDYIVDDMTAADHSLWYPFFVSK